MSIITILEKVFLSSGSIKDEDLQKFLEATDRLKSQELIDLLLRFQSVVEKDELKRIISFIPQNHQESLDILLLCNSVDNKEYKKLYETYKQLRKDLVDDLKIRYLTDHSQGKEFFKTYIKSLSLSKIAHMLKGIEELDESQLNTDLKEILEGMGQAKKVI